MRKVLLVVAVLITAGLIGGLTARGSWSFFRDIEVSSENISRVGTWSHNPSLELEPDDAEVETKSSSVYHSIWVKNDADQLKDLAKNVELGVSVIKGGGYVSQILYNPEVGDIPAGGKKQFSLTVKLTGWEGAPKEEEVKLRIEVTREDSWPEHNVGKRAHFTIEKGD